MARPQYGKRVHTMSIKLTDTQLVILSTAAQREDRCLVTPKSLTTAPREGTKMARVVGLLQRDRGATLAEIIATTDWLPHTTRAALTGLRKRGYVVTLDRSDDERGSTYSIPLDRNLADGKEGVPAIEPPTASVARSKKAARATKPEQNARAAAGPVA